MRVRPGDDVAAALRVAGVRTGRPVLVCVGGAGNMSAGDLEAVGTLFRDGIVPVLTRTGTAVVDGGTDAGVMAAIGQARASAGADFPLVGVAAVGTVDAPGVDGADPGGAALEPHHTLIVLVDGADWGDESPWLSTVASALSAGAPSATLVVNGGSITWDDVGHSLDAGRCVIVVAGTGRTADAIAAARAGDAGDERATAVATSPLVAVVRLDDPPGAAAAVSAALLPGDAAGRSGDRVEV